LRVKLNVSGTLFVLNGPNLNALGKREPGIYGAVTLADIETSCRQKADELGCVLEFRQTNHEGVLVDWLHEAGEKAEGVVINPGAYGHTSIALHDAIRAIGIHAREAFRHRTMIAPVVKGVICGFGPAGYPLALQALVGIVNQQKN
jgi:3-dehydroquinate dehydratase II